MFGLEVDMLINNVIDMLKSRFCLCTVFVFFECLMVFFSGCYLFDF